MSITKNISEVTAAIAMDVSSVDKNGGRLKDCNLSDNFGMFIQGLLAFTAFCILILKRFREPKTERRPMKIWFFDASKQGIGAMIIHFANIFISDLFSGDPCTWYLINFLLDSTVGLLLIYIGLKVTQIFIIRHGWDTLHFGEYGSPPQCNSWIGQCGVYILVLLFEKFIITLLLQFNFWIYVRKFILKPLKPYPNAELVVVMLIIPFLINALMFWMVDNFLMRKRTKAQDDDKMKVRYNRKLNTIADSDEEAILLQNEQDEQLSNGLIIDDQIHHREGLNNVVVHR